MGEGNKNPSLQLTTLHAKNDVVVGLAIALSQLRLKATKVNISFPIAVIALLLLITLGQQLHARTVVYRFSNVNNDEIYCPLLLIILLLLNVKMKPLIVPSSVCIVFENNCI